MIAEGKITQVQRDLFTEKLNISFLVGDLPLEELQDLMAKDELEITVRPKTRKRSLNANSYFHVLAGKIAEKMHTSLSYVKNWLLFEYGWPMLDEDGYAARLVMDPSVPEEAVLEMSDPHMWPVGIDYNYGGTIYQLQRGSHTYNNKEMANLIDGAVEQARKIGVETLTPDQIARMEAAWHGEHHTE